MLRRLCLLCCCLIPMVSQAQSEDSLELAMSRFKPLYHSPLAAEQFDSLLAGGDDYCWRLVENDGHRVYWFYCCEPRSRIATGLYVEFDSQPEILAVIASETGGDYRLFSSESDNDLLRCLSVKLVWWDLRVKIGRY